MGPDARLARPRRGACYDVATALGTPFVSGKDSLNNEFRPKDSPTPIAIPPSLLITALGQIDDVARSVTMDLKAPGNRLYLVGVTRDEMGGRTSPWSRAFRRAGRRSSRSKPPAASPPSMRRSTPGWSGRTTT